MSSAQSCLRPPRTDVLAWRRRHCGTRERCAACSTSRRTLALITAIAIVLLILGLTTEVSESGWLLALVLVAYVIAVLLPKRAPPTLPHLSSCREAALTVVRVALAVVAAGLTALWVVDIAYGEWSNSAEEVLWLAGGAITGALAGLATGLRPWLMVSTLLLIGVATIAAFVAMPRDVEHEGGAALVLWWTISALVASVICAALAAPLWRTFRLG